MAFLTKLDFSSNRQVKQHPETITVLSGGTSFGVPFSALTTGPNLLTSGITQSYSLITSTFSGNSGTTNYSWYDIRMSLAASTLSALTPSNSASTQNTGQVYTASSLTIIDGNTVYLAYTGVSYNITVTGMTDLGGGNYSGSVLTGTLDILSANTLDFTGRTIWVDVSGITRTNDLIVTKNPQIGYVLTCVDTEGKVEFSPVSGSSGIDIRVTGGTFTAGTATFTNNTGGTFTVTGFTSGSTGSTSPYQVGDVASAIKPLLGVNSTCSSYSVVNGGDGNSIYSDFFGASSIGGGCNNIINGWFGTISGGKCNKVGRHTDTSSGGYESFIGGGECNTISGGSHSTIGGGFFNLLTGDTATIGGGESNCSSGYSSTIGGGNSNKIYSDYSTIGGGLNNTASGYGGASVLGGSGNTASGAYSTIGGGQGNSTDGTGTGNVVAGGVSNSASGGYGHNVIGGGKSNISYGACNSTISGGYCNNISYGIGSSVGGGNCNIVCNDYSRIGGGFCNTSCQTSSTIGGGICNTASGCYSFIGGGCYNLSSGINSGILGGICNKADNTNTFVIGSNITGSTSNTTYVDKLNIKTVGAGPGITDLGVDAGGNVVDQASDIKLKENINTIENALNKVLSLRGVTYNWKDKEKGGTALKIGFIAQEVSSTVPELAYYNSNGDYMGVHYKDVTALLVEAIKELVSGETISNNTHLETQTILAEDNNIELNYNGTKESAIGGGITVIDGISKGKPSLIVIDSEGNWITNNDFKAKDLTIPKYTPTSSTDNNGKYGNITMDDNFLYIKTNVWKRINMEEF